MFITIFLLQIFLYKSTGRRKRNLKIKAEEVTTEGKNEVQRALGEDKRIDLLTNG